MPPPAASSSVATASASAPGPTRSPPLPQPSPLPLPATTPQRHWHPHGIEIDNAAVGAAPEVGGPEGVGGGGAASDEGAANGEGATDAIIDGGIEGGEEEVGGAIEEHDGVAVGDVEGEGVVKDDALGVEVGGDAGGGGGEGGMADDEALGGGVDGGDGIGRAIEGVEEEGLHCIVASDLVPGVTAALQRDCRPSRPLPPAYPPPSFPWPQASDLIQIEPEPDPHFMY